MALNLSRIFGGKSARESATGPAGNQLESENGGLETADESPAAIALDTWEHAATGPGLGGPDTAAAAILPYMEQSNAIDPGGTSEADGIMVWNGETVSHGVMKDGADNITLENYAQDPGGAAQPDGIMVWNGQPVSHGFKSTSGMDDKPEIAARTMGPDEPPGYHALVKNESLREVEFLTAESDGSGIIRDHEQRAAGDADGDGAVDGADYVVGAARRLLDA